MRLISTFLALGFVSSHLSASVTLTSTMGILRDASGVALDDSHPTTTSTLWAMIADNGDDVLPGNLGVGESLVDGVDSLAAHTAFNGASMAVGETFNGDKVFAVGSVLTAAGGIVFSVDTIDFAGLGITAGQEWALYWFPGVAGTSIPTSAFQVGGINEIVAYDTAASAAAPMQVAPDGTTVTTAVTDATLTDVARFTAINAVPEPSVGLLSLLGLGLLRRRR